MRRSVKGTKNDPNMMVSTDLATDADFTLSASDFTLLDRQPVTCRRGRSPPAREGQSYQEHSPGFNAEAAPPVSQRVATRHGEGTPDSLPADHKSGPATHHSSVTGAPGTL